MSGSCKYGVGPLIRYQQAKCFSNSAIALPMIHHHHKLKAKALGQIHKTFPMLIWILKFKVSPKYEEEHFCRISCYITAPKPVCQRPQIPQCYSKYMRNIRNKIWGISGTKREEYVEQNMRNVRKMRNIWGFFCCISCCIAAFKLACQRPKTVSLLSSLW